MAELRVMTWNVQNLLRVGHENGPRTSRELDRKIEALVPVVDDFRPHVLALQEVGVDAVLQRFQDALTWKMPHAASGVPDERGIRVAFCSVRVIRDAVDVTSFPPGLLPVQVGDDRRGAAGPRTINEMGRGALEITIRANRRDVRLVTCHLKSKLLSFPGGRFAPRDEGERARFGAYALFRRAAEAATVRDHLNSVLANNGRDRPVVLLGDMNDMVEAATTQILNGPTGSEIGTRGFDAPDRGDGQRLFNLAPLIDPDRRFSRIYRGRGELIDHMFVSRFLAGRVESVTTLGGPLPSIDDDPRTMRGDPGTDHAAVAATLDF